METTEGSADSARSIETGHLWPPGFLIRRVNQIHIAMFFESSKDSAITPAQYGRPPLSERPNLDQTSLCAEVGVNRTTMADVLRRQEERGGG